MPYAYILYSEKLDKFYVGSCVNLSRRIYEHNIGHSKFTSTGIPWTIVYREEFTDFENAKSRELEIKKRKSRRYIESLIKSDRL